MPSVLDNPFIQFVVGGVTLVAVSWLANMKAGIMVFFAALLATLPVMDMLPVATISDRATARSYALKNAVANVGVIAGMLALVAALTTEWPTWGVVGVGLATWFVVALCLDRLVAYFMPT